MVSLGEQPLGNSFEKVFIGNAGSAGGDTVDITDVFSTYLYTGNGSGQTITNGIDLDGEGGLVWSKVRSGAGAHLLQHKTSHYLSSNNNGYENADARLVTQFNSDGYNLGIYGGVNGNGDSMVSWTFRKSAKFFDIVTYTGNGTAGTQIAHGLGSVPGMIIFKKTNAADNWAVYHRGANGGTDPEDYRLELNENFAETNRDGFLNDTAPTATHFTVGDGALTNTNNATYVAYIFAHNDDDGGFGPDGDQDIIKCGSYAQDYDGAEVNLGFEPQWILFKSADATYNWYIFDTMRGIVTGGLSGDGDAALFPNTGGAENVNTFGIDLTPTGFIAYGNNVANTGDVVYMAIRRGPLAPPEAATEVFKPVLATSVDAYSVGFETDFALFNKIAGLSFNTIATTRLQGGGIRLSTATTAAEVASNVVEFDLQDSFKQGILGSSPLIRYHWKRAPSYFDCVAYLGNGTAGRTVSHNLGVAPEMMWVKRREATGSWMVYHKGLNGGTNPEQYVMYLNDTQAPDQTNGPWNYTAPASSVFTLGNNNGVNNSSGNYIAYLFASLDGVSKVGSVSHSGTTNVDCGFSNGARFVMLKRYDAGSNFFVWDTVRGIVAGDDPYLRLNSANGEITNTDFVDPLNAGFTISDAFTDGDYIFYAIA